MAKKPKAKVLELAVNRAFWNIEVKSQHGVLTCSPQDCGGTMWSLHRSKNGGRIVMVCAECGGVYMTTWSAE